MKRKGSPYPLLVPSATWHLELPHELQPWPKPLCTHTCLGAVPLRSPTYLLLTHTGSRSTLGLTKLSFPGKATLPQTGIVCAPWQLCHLGFPHKTNPMNLEQTQTKRRKTLKAVAIWEHEIEQSCPLDTRCTSFSRKNCIY